jgi:preprotein translocase YajC subunit
MADFMDDFLNVSTVLLIYMAIIFLYNYWKNSKVYRERTNQLEKFKKSLRVNDYVIFSGGIKGKVISINNIWVTVEVSNGIQLEILLNSIMSVLHDKQ